MDRTIVEKLVDAKRKHADATEELKLTEEAIEDHEHKQLLEQGAKNLGTTEGDRKAKYRHAQPELYRTLREQQRHVRKTKLELEIQEIYFKAEQSRSQA